MCSIILLEVVHFIKNRNLMEQNWIHPNSRYLTNYITNFMNTMQVEFNIYSLVRTTCVLLRTVLTLAEPGLEDRIPMVAEVVAGPGAIVGAIAPVVGREMGAESCCCCCCSYGNGFW